jgi:hypothetical protein
MSFMDEYNEKDANTITADYKRYASYVVKDKIFETAKNAFERHSKRPLSLYVDLASGRGNDLHRWIIKGYKNIIGIEMDEEQYEESIKRLATVRKQGRMKGMRVEYANCSVLDAECVYKATKSSKADIVGCFFAENYFWKSSETLNSHLKVLSEITKKGSLFVGTCADGDTIDYLLRTYGPIDCSTFTLRPAPGSTPENNFEKGYNIALKTPYFDEGERLFTEYIVKKDSFVDALKVYGFIPCKISKYPPLCNFSYVDDQNNPYKWGNIIRSLFFQFSFIRE